MKQTVGKDNNAARKASMAGMLIGNWQSSSGIGGVVVGVRDQSGGLWYSSMRFADWEAIEMSGRRIYFCDRSFVVFTFLCRPSFEDERSGLIINDLWAAYDIGA